MPDYYNGQTGGFNFANGLSASVPGIVLSYSPHVTLDAPNYTTGVLQLAWTMSGSYTGVTRAGFNYYSDSGYESYEVYDDTSEGSFIWNIQLQPGTGGGWVAQGTANTSSLNFWNINGQTLNLAVWTQSNNAPGAIQVTYNRTVMFKPGETYFVPSRIPAIGGGTSILRKLLTIGLLKKEKTLSTKLLESVLRVNGLITSYALNP